MYSAKANMLMDQQYAILQEIWSAIAVHGYGHEIVNRLNAEYDNTVVDLLAELGDRSPASVIDCAEYETFSNLFKDENGIRPRGYTYRSMIDWMEYRRKAA